LPTIPNFIPRHRAAARLIPKQLSKNPANLKNATRDIDRSSIAVRDEAKMERKTVGVTGILPRCGSGGIGEVLLVERVPERGIFGPEFR